MSTMTESRAGTGISPPATAVLAPTYEGDFVLDEPLELECGRSLAGVTLHYAVYGRLNAARENAVLVCHALTGSALVGSWWPEIFAPGAVLSLEQDFVICINMLGSCYGSTGPGSVDPETGEVYGPDFPLVSIRDNVRAQAKLLDSLGVRRLRLVLGGSIGGMQALDWAMYDPERVARAVIIGVSPLSAMGLALNHLQRQAIQHDPEWKGGHYLPQRPPRKGLGLARQIGMISYKSAELFDERFGRKPNRNGENPWGVERQETGQEGNQGENREGKQEGGQGSKEAAYLECVLIGGQGSSQSSGLIGGRFDIAGYLDHQGERFIDRFDANSYLAILRTMDTWDPLRGYSSPAEAFGRIRARLSFVGISSDWLFPPQGVRDFAYSIRAAGVQADYREMTSAHGHDAFLAEQVELVRLLQ